MQSWLKFLYIIFSPKSAKITLKPVVVIQKSNLRKVIIFYFYILRQTGKKKCFIALVTGCNIHRLLQQNFSQPAICSADNGCDTGDFAAALWPLPVFQSLTISFFFWRPP